MIAIASRMLGHELEGKKGTFFNFRHTGTSHIKRRLSVPAVRRLRAAAERLAQLNGLTAVIYP